MRDKLHWVKCELNKGIEIPKYYSYSKNKFIDCVLCLKNKNFIMGLLVEGSSKNFVNYNLLFQVRKRLIKLEAK